MTGFSRALVTGATSGLGESLARLLANQGVELLLVGRDQNKLSSLEGELGRYVSVAQFPCDLTDPIQRTALLERTLALGPDLILNCAGQSRYGATEGVPIGEQLEVLELNAVALTEISLRYFQYWADRGERGTIVNISSTLAFLPAPGAAVYAASKAYVTSFSQALDWEGRRRGIRVLTSCPGQMATSFFERATHGVSAGGDLHAVQPGVAAQEVWWQILRNKRLHIFDGWYRGLVWLSRLVPAALLNRRLYATFVSRASACETQPKKKGW